MSPIHPHKEPEEIFLPLSQEHYAQFYALEMDTHAKDITFYRNHCKDGSRILELGCGTGRISRALVPHHEFVLGLDLSLSMLQQFVSHSGKAPSCVCMDMTAMAFQKKFDHILIPHNTLNLLKDITKITACLQQSASLLTSHGSLLLQLHIPDQELLAACDSKLFQFQIFDLPENKGRLIKETLRSYSEEAETIHLEERYRIRPIPAPKQRQDFNHCLTLAGFSVETWIRLFKENGFPHLSLFGNDGSQPFKPGHDSRLFISAKPHCKHI